jgi:hypothetical protein
MTKDEIIEMARQVKMPYFFTDGTIVNIVKLEAFAKLVAEREREECAKLCDEMSITECNMSKTWRNACLDMANEIRERGQE